MTSLSTKKILLVDDNPFILEIVRDEICANTSVLPENIFFASSGNSAIELIRSGQFYDLIVSEFNMPDGNGKELLEFLIQQKSKTYFILFTSTLNLQIPVISPNFLGVIDKQPLWVLTSMIDKVFS